MFWTICNYSFQAAWIFTFGIGVVLMGLLMIYRQMDKRRFELLYKKEG